MHAQGEREGKKRGGQKFEIICTLNDRLTARDYVETNGNVRNVDGSMQIS